MCGFALMAQAWAHPLMPSSWDNFFEKESLCLKCKFRSWGFFS